jgi:protein NrfC
VHVCPTGASHIRKEDGIVDVNPDLCVGCMYCLAACPYQVRFINPVTKVADKCDFCRKTNLAAGKEPACVESCPTKALVFGNLDDPDSPIAKRLVKETTYRYKQALGTSPKMYRVPKGEIKS